MAEMAAERGVPVEQVQNPRLRDARRIQHNGAGAFLRQPAEGRVTHEDPNRTFPKWKRPVNFGR